MYKFVLGMIAIGCACGCVSSRNYPADHISASVDTVEVGAFSNSTSQVGLAARFVDALRRDLACKCELELVETAGDIVVSGSVDHFACFCRGQSHMCSILTHIHIRDRNERAELWQGRQCGAEVKWDGVTLDSAIRLAVDGVSDVIVRGINESRKE